ncbi:hypothetical protein NC652_020717 [Populus alba x Populus x berolinensis]|nr:hypothetical protein NC652_020717 [Populus alba x Populus x berolinensis]
MAWKQNPIGKKVKLARQKGRGEELESGRGRSLGFGIFRQCIYFTWSGIVYSIAPSGLGFTSTQVLLENGSGYMCKSNRGMGKVNLLRRLLLMLSTSKESALGYDEG